MFKYFPHTKNDIAHMLKLIGINDINDLFKTIPTNLKNNANINLDPLNDFALETHMKEIGNKNKQLKIFRGAGSYDHYQPAAVGALASMQAFLTSYTPYQPEVAQGTLHYIFEFQSMINELTGMEVANASMYDGPTSCAEAMFMATSITSRNKILISNNIFPHVLNVVKTYAKYRGIEIVELPSLDGETDFTNLDLLSKDVAGLIVSYPNKYGIIENLEGISNIIHNNGGLLITYTELQSLVELKTPSEYNADINVGEMQSLGIPLNFGGPYLGFLATRFKYIRKMPGRICGYTNDVDGRDGFALTFQTREQHIRRGKANSNICSNQSLMALQSTIYLSLLGNHGMSELFRYCLNGSHFLYNELIKTGMFSDPFNKPFYKEFTLKANFNNIEAFQSYLINNKVLGPHQHTDNLLSFAVTEKLSKADLDHFIKLVRDFKWELI